MLKQASLQFTSKHWQRWSRCDVFRETVPDPRETVPDPRASRSKWSQKYTQRNGHLKKPGKIREFESDHGKVGENVFISCDVLLCVMRWSQTSVIRVEMHETDMCTRRSKKSGHPRNSMGVCFFRPPCTYDAYINMSEITYSYFISNTTEFP